MRGRGGMGEREELLDLVREEVAGEGTRRTTQLNILFLNAQSIVGKIDELTCTAYDIEPDLILVSETWCSENVTDAFLSIPGYELHQDMRQDREDTAGGRGGRLLVYSKTGLKILKLDKNADFQQYCKFSVEDVTVYLVYRPPSRQHK